MVMETEGFSLRLMDPKAAQTVKLLGFKEQFARWST